MTDAVELDIAYVAPVTLVPRRARTEKTLRVAGSVRVAVPVVSGADAPVVLRGRGNGTFERRLHEGRLVAAMGGAEGRQGGLDWLRRMLADSNRVVGELFRRSRTRPWETPRYGAAMPAFERVVSDGRDAMEARVRQAAASLVVVDGMPCVATPEPILLADRDRRMSVSPRVYGDAGWNDRAPASFGFRIDRREAFADFLGRNVRAGGYELMRGAEIPEVVLDVCEASALEFREDMHNAWWAAMSALWVGGENLGVTPVGMAEGYVDLMRMRDGLLAGRTDPGDVDAKLAELAGMRGEIGRMVLFKNTIGIGRDAIAASLRTWRPAPEDAPALEEDDLEALEGLGAWTC